MRSSAVGVAHHNEAQYRGTGSVRVCERADSGNTLLTRRCALTYVSDRNELDPYYAAGIIMVLKVGNDSGAAHTIHGYSAGYNLSAYD